LRTRGSYQPEGASANATDYQFVFLRRAHRLLALGYEALIPHEYSHAVEEDITGRLVEEVERILDDPETPPWTQWFAVHEDPRVHDAERRGKRRRRIDIRIDSAEKLPRSRLSFEAKRLGPDHGVSVYLGEEGLQCFIHGRYARHESSVGMLGYVQALAAGIAHPEAGAYVSVRSQQTHGRETCRGLPHAAFVQLSRCAAEHP